MTYKKSQELTGRVDSEESNALRFHQIINYINLDEEEIQLAPSEQGIVFLEFAVDEGVKRNKGRDGAALGAHAISKAMANLPVHFEDKKLFHAGQIICHNGNLEETQIELGFYVEKILKQNSLPIILGGGHEVTFGNYLGVKNFHKNKKIGLINFDAHFDIRPLDEEIGATSGNSFWQIANNCRKNMESFNYLALGIQKTSNTKLLFEIADDFGCDYVLGDDFTFENKLNLLSKIEKFILDNDVIYLTFCMDVFATPYAPGVSAPSINGIEPNEVFKSCFDLIVNCGKLASLDFAETNPHFDIDNRTAKLAASLIFRVL
jgi:formiminoglutamase